MDPIQHTDSATFFLALGVLLALARILGALARRLGQPSVLGELTAGVLLGPSVLGLLNPDLVAWLYPSTGPSTVARDALTKLALVLFLLCAGLEVDLSTLRRQRRVAVCVSLAGLIVPFAVGFAAGLALPGFIGAAPGKSALVLPMFLGTALSISALPVIAKILRDLNLSRTDVGVLIVASAIVDDLVGWILFATVLAMASNHSTGAGVARTCVLTLLFAGLILTVGRRLIDHALGAGSDREGAGLGVVLVLAFTAAAFTEWSGTHANFGAFLIGVAIGNCRRVNRLALRSLDDCVTGFLAPLFFASVGLKVNFVAHFHAPLVLLVLVIATTSKLFGCWLGARVAGMPKREAWAIGCGMNARGAMEIVLAVLALQAGVIREPMFVAIVVMALVTSAASALLLRAIMVRKENLDTAPKYWEPSEPTKPQDWRAPAARAEV